MAGDEHDAHLVHDTTPKRIKLEVLSRRGVIALLIVNWLTLILSGALDFGETPLRNQKLSRDAQALHHNVAAGTPQMAPRVIPWTKERSVFGEQSLGGVPLSSGAAAQRWVAEARPASSSGFLPLFMQSRWQGIAGPLSVANRYLIVSVDGLAMNMSTPRTNSTRRAPTRDTSRQLEFADGPGIASQQTLVECEVSAEGSNDRSGPWVPVADYLGRFRSTQTLVCEGHPANGTNTSSPEYQPPFGSGVCQAVDVLALSQLAYFYYRINISRFSLGMDTAAPVSFEYQFHSQFFTLVELIVTLILIVISLSFLVFWYVQIVRVHNWATARPEQRWCGWLLIALVCYQNPLFFLEIYRSTDTPSVLSADVLQILSISVFFAFWLMMIDVLSRAESVNKLGGRFYIRKIAFAIIWALGAIWLSVFLRVSVISPSIGMPGSDDELTNPFLSAVLLIITAVVAFLMVCLALIWCIWFFVLLRRTRNALLQAPFLQSRYRQLSFRFLVLLCWSVIFYTIVSAFAGAFALSSQGRLGVLLSMQSSSMGRMILLSVYSYTVVFTFLPPDASLSRTCTSGRYAHHATRFWLSQPRAGSVSGGSVFVSDLFCLETAVKCLELSLVVYYDPPLQFQDPTYRPAGFGDMNLDRLRDVAEAAVASFWSHAPSDTHAMVASFSSVTGEQTRQQSIDSDDLINGREELLASTHTDSSVEESASNDTIAFVFRGTSSRSNIATDLNAQMTPLDHIHKHDTHLHSTRHRMPTIGEPRIHRGFHDAFYGSGCDRWLRQELDTRVEAMRTRCGRDCTLTVLCTGHSLGGALATIAAWEAAKYNDTEQAKHGRNAIRILVVCYTFGSPRVGNHAFSRFYDQQVPLTFRVVNGKDIITSVPKLLWVFKHVGNEVLIDSVGNVVTDMTIVERAFGGSRRGFKDHTLGAYVASLAACARLAAEGMSLPFPEGLPYTLQRLVHVIAQETLGERDDTANELVAKKKSMKQQRYNSDLDIDADHAFDLFSKLGGGHSRGSYDHDFQGLVLQDSERTSLLSRGFDLRRTN